MSKSGEMAELSRRGAVSLISFHPANDGTISNKGAAALVHMLERELTDERVRAIVITGAREGIFIRHANLSQIARAAEAVANGGADEYDFAASPFPRLGAMLDSATKPVIAAINGDCMGGGLEIALACTIRVAAEGTRAIGLPEIRIGIPPGSGGPQRLARLIGRHRARLFTLEGMVLDAHRAHKLGLIDYLAQDPVADALARAEALSARPSTTVSEIMRQMQPPDAAEIEDNIRGFARSIGQPATAAALAEIAARAPKLELLD